MNVCKECETEYLDQECPKCRSSSEFAALEEMSLRLEDELYDRQSELRWAKESIKSYEDAVELAEKRLRENERKLREFKWWNSQPQAIGTTE